MHQPRLAKARYRRGPRIGAAGQLQARASGSLRLILARGSPALRLVHVHFPKAGFELSEPYKPDPLC